MFRIESRASERNGHSENNKPALPTGSPESREGSLLLLGSFARKFTQRTIALGRLAVREELQNPISSEFISASKHSNFENRTESAESRAPERDGAFGEK